jgi:4-hydroxy-tetrahydrodipicolinate synthase
MPMTPLTRTSLRGTWGTLLLPIAGDDSIDLAVLGEEIDLLIAAGVDGIYSNGTAGEFFNQSENEFDQTSELLARRCQAKRMPFQLGVSHMSPIISLERLQRAKALKPDGFQVILPDWFPVTDDEAEDFLLRMAEAAAPVPLVLYNPPHAKRSLKPESYARLAKIPGLIGVKVPGGDAAWYAAMRKTGLSVFVPGHFLATGYRQGAHGAYSNVACLDPLAAVRWFELMQRDMDAALAIERALQQFLNTHLVPILAKGYCNAALDKLLAAIGGWARVGTRLRWPYRWLPAEEAARLRPFYERELADFLALRQAPAVAQAKK